MVLSACRDIRFSHPTQFIPSQNFLPSSLPWSVQNNLPFDSTLPTQGVKMISQSCSPRSDAHSLNKLATGQSCDAGPKMSTFTDNFLTSEIGFRIVDPQEKVLTPYPDLRMTRLDENEWNVGKDLQLSTAECLSTGSSKERISVSLTPQLPSTVPLNRSFRYEQLCFNQNRKRGRTKWRSYEDLGQTTAEETRSVKKSCHSWSCTSTAPSDTLIDDQGDEHENDDSLIGQLVDRDWNDLAFANEEFGNEKFGTDKFGRFDLQHGFTMASNGYGTEKSPINTPGSTSQELLTDNWLTQIPSMKIPDEQYEFEESTNKLSGQNIDAHPENSLTYWPEENSSIPPNEILSRFELSNLDSSYERTLPNLDDVTLNSDHHWYYSNCPEPIQQSRGYDIFGNHPILKKEEGVRTPSNDQHAQFLALFQTAPSSDAALDTFSDVGNPQIPSTVWSNPDTPIPQNGLEDLTNNLDNLANYPEDLLSKLLMQQGNADSSSRSTEQNYESMNYHPLSDFQLSCYADLPVVQDICNTSGQTRHLEPPARVARPKRLPSSQRRHLIKPSRIGCYQLHRLMPFIVKQFHSSSISRKGLCRQLTGQLYPDSPKPSPNFLLNTLLPVFRAAEVLGFEWSFNSTSSLSYLRSWVCSQRGGRELLHGFRVEYNAPTGKRLETE